MRSLVLTSMFYGLLLGVCVGYLHEDTPEPLREGWQVEEIYVELHAPTEAMPAFQKRVMECLRD